MEWNSDGIDIRMAYMKLCIEKRTDTLQFNASPRVMTLHSHRLSHHDTYTLLTPLPKNNTSSNYIPYERLTNLFASTLLPLVAVHDELGERFIRYYCKK